MKRISLVLLASLTSLAVVVSWAAPATAHHGRSVITNSTHSGTKLQVSTECLNGVLGTNPLAYLYPGSSTGLYDKGWRVPYGWEYDAIRNGSTWRNNFISGVTGPEGVCVGGSDAWVLVLTRKVR
jgi:hypothetical protein